MTVLASRKFSAQNGIQKTGPWLIWLHGLWGCKEEWQPIMNNAGDYPSLVIDLPGHGESVSFRAENFEQVNQLINATLTANGIDDYWLIGYSLGGRLAMYHAASGKPAGLRGLIIEAGNPGLATADERNARLRHDNHLAQQLRERPLADFLYDWYRQGVFADLSEAQRQQRVAQHLHHNAFAIADMLSDTSLGHQPDLADILKQLTVPLLYICGERDTKFCAIARAHQFTLRTIPDAGHNTHQANPAVFAQAIRTFLLLHSV
ncbi:2-succinyl-6-hydroxy-2,4-cyclohexadiene-1-carboxylate synthase [Morganella psychrotolerans]|uniref:2-succinyl-6-hydroxy-2, 4-cyclohexadiene-1-carboxylate synthase n=1 Tax=Morganella psychrotolerans TaxID=368603 RepID=UPI0039AFA31B